MDSGVFSLGAVLFSGNEIDGLLLLGHRTISGLDGFAVIDGNFPVFTCHTALLCT